MWLLFVAVLSFVVPNGLLLYWLLHDFTTLQAALQNRLALAFILDVFLTSGLLQVREVSGSGRVPPRTATGSLLRCPNRGCPGRGLRNLRSDCSQSGQESWRTGRAIAGRAGWQS